MLALINNQTDIIGDIMEKIRNMNIFTPFIYDDLHNNESIYNESIYNESIYSESLYNEMPSPIMNQNDYIICATLLVSIYLLYYNEMQNTKINNMKDKMKQHENEFTKISRQIKRVNNIINTYYD
jgi:hypothetical protein